MNEHRFLARISTHSQISRVEQWLDENTIGDWTIKLEDISENFNHKIYLLAFDDRGDRDMFRKKFTHHALTHHEHIHDDHAHHFFHLFDKK